MATGLVNGEWQILTPYRIETPKPIDKTFCTRDYVREMTLYTKFGANPSTWGFWVNRWNITLFTFFRQLTYRSYRATDFGAGWLKRRVFTKGSAFLGLKKLKLTLNLFLCPQRSNFGKKWTWKIFGRKPLNNGTLRSKRPLIVIVAP